MEDDLIWTRDDIVRFTHDAEWEVRAWAWGWLERHHPEEAGRLAARGIADPILVVALTALSAYGCHPTPEVAQAIEAMLLQTDLPPALRTALERRGAPEPTRVHDPEHEEDERLARNPEELRRKAPSMLVGKSYSEYLRAHWGLSHQQHRWATDILLDHFASLVTRREDTELWATLESLNDPRSLPAILAAWQPGQHGAAALYARIHRLAALSVPLPEGIARDVEADNRRREERRKASEAGDVGPRAPARIDVQCRACGRTGEYEADDATMSKMLQLQRRAGKGRRGAAKAPLVVCKYCGAKNTFRLPPDTFIVALGAAARLHDEGSRGKN